MENSSHSVCFSFNLSFSPVPRGGAKVVLRCFPCNDKCCFLLLWYSFLSFCLLSTSQAKPRFTIVTGPFLLPLHPGRRLLAAHRLKVYFALFLPCVWISLLERFAGVSHNSYDSLLMPRQARVVFLATGSRRTEEGRQGKSRLGSHSGGFLLQ